MIYLIAAYLLQAMGATVLLAAAVVAFVYIPRPWGPRLAAAAGGAFLMILAHTYGFHTMHVRCQELAASYQAQIDARDRNINQSQATLAEVLDRARGVVTKKDQEIADYEKRLKAAGACPLSDADRNWLRSIR